MSHAALSSALTIVMALGGFGFGLAYFAIVRRTAVLLGRGRGAGGPLGLTLGRAGAVVVFLGAAAQLGAAVLLASVLGFLLARTVAVRAARRSL